MSDWIQRYALGWNSEWLGPCPSTTFAYEFPISFDWSSDCGDLSGAFPGYGDSGVATLVLDLESRYRVTHRWSTDVRKFASGDEQRSSRNKISRDSYSGSAVLLDDRPRSVRTQMAQHAATGAVFLLGLSHEGLALVADADSRTVYVGDTELCDWAAIGQRVVVAHVDSDDQTQFVDAVIQDVSATSFDLDVEPGEIGAIGGVIMPAKAIYLAPQQNFPRFPVDAEMWDLDAQGAGPLDYAPELARIPLSSLSSPFADAVAAVRVFGLAGNNIYLDLQNNGTSTGQMTETGTLTTFRYEPSVTTLGDFAAALSASVNFILTGNYDPEDTFGASDDLFINAAGAADMGFVGRGVELTEYDDAPVWDEPLSVPEATVTDGVHALTQIIDHGGIPYALGTAEQADWFRSVQIANGDTEVWQWFKLFMSTVRARAKSFWLPTWRADLVYVEHDGDEVTIDSEGFTVWWPSLRSHVQIEQADGTITYAQVAAAVQDGDSHVLTISETLSSSAVTRIGWLERCRFEDADEYTTTHGQAGFSVVLTARAVPVPVSAPETDDAVLDIESTVEDCLPVELITIAHGTTTYRLTTGTTDQTDGDGYVYKATAASRDAIGVVPLGETDSETTITLPIDHALVKRYLRQLQPPQLITVTIRRLYLPSLLSEIAFTGEVTSLSVDNENTTATFRVEARAGHAAKRPVPTTSVSRVCPYILYGAGCDVSRTASVGGLAHKVTSSVIHVDGRDVRVDIGSTDRLDGWAVGGELVVTSGEATGERMSIMSQLDLSPPFSTAVVLTLRFPISGLKNGNGVEVYAGCDHTLATCVDKFDNRQNYGGYPSIPTDSILKWRR